MTCRLGFVLAVVLLLPVQVGAQIVRFETTAGNLDLLLNPTGNPILQGHVDNMLQYVLSGRYDGTVINRAVEGFVLQMGLFDVAGPELPATIDGFVQIEPFAPIAGEPASEWGLSNTNGTVGLALPGRADGGSDQDGGTSSFFINLASNTFLDADYTVFAEVVDMTTIDSIMALPQIDLTEVPTSGAEIGNLHFSDVPLLPNGDLVLISRAFVVPEPSVGMLVGWIIVGCFVSRGQRRRP